MRFRSAVIFGLAVTISLSVYAPTSFSRDAKKPVAAAPEKPKADISTWAKPSPAQTAAAKKLGVKKIVLGECGHAHKALTVIADRVLVGDLQIPRHLINVMADLEPGEVEMKPWVAELW